MNLINNEQYDKAIKHVNGIKGKTNDIKAYLKLILMTSIQNKSNDDYLKIVANQFFINLNQYYNPNKIDKTIQNL